MWVPYIFKYWICLKLKQKGTAIYHIAKLGSRQVAPESFMDLFGKMNFGEECKQWDSEADLVRVVQYARGSKKLSIPREWRELIPKTIPF